MTPPPCAHFVPQGETWGGNTNSVWGSMPSASETYTPAHRPTLSVPDNVKQRAAPAAAAAPVVPAAADEGMLTLEQLEAKLRGATLATPDAAPTVQENVPEPAVAGAKQAPSQTTAQDVPPPGLGAGSAPPNLPPAQAAVLQQMVQRVMAIDRQRGEMQQKVAGLQQQLAAESKKLRPPPQTPPPQTYIQEQAAVKENCARLDQMLRGCHMQAHALSNEHMQLQHQMREIHMRAAPKEVRIGMIRQEIAHHQQ